MSDQLPVEGDVWQRLSPLAVAASGVQAIKNAIVPIIAIVFGSQAIGDGSQGMAWIALPVILAIIGVNLLAAWFRWIRLRYRVGAEDITVEQGLVSRTARSVPYERIQDVSIEQKPIPRLLGLAEVRFETGAGGKDELSLAYVTLEEGERLRDVVRDLRDEVERGGAPLPAAESGASHVAEQGQLLFAMDAKRLATFGLFEFSLVIFAVLLGAAQQFEFLLPDNVWEVIGSWFEEGRYNEAGAYLSGVGLASQVVGGLFALGAVIVVGIATGIASTLMRDWNFRLERTSKGFRRRRGLFTRTDVVMPVHRVQASVIDTGLFRRLRGWHGLSFISLAQDAKSANHTVAPFAQMEEIARILEAAHFALPAAETNWHRPSPDYFLARALVPIVPLAIGGALAVVLAPVAAAGLAMFALAGFIAVRSHYLWRFERHAVDPRQILSRHGWLAPTLKIADRVKLHSVEIRQGPLARWRGYADLHFGLAGGTLAFNGLVLADAQEMREAVLSSIAAVDFSRLARPALVTGD